MTWHWGARAYGDMRRDELDIIEVGALAAHSYDEAFAIQSRLVRATGEPLVLMQQIEWQRAAHSRQHPDR